MLVPSSLPSGSSSFAQAPGSSQDLQYALGTSGNAGPSIGPVTSDDDDHDDTD